MKVNKPEKTLSIALSLAMAANKVPVNVFADEKPAELDNVKIEEKENVVESDDDVFTAEELAAITAIECAESNISDLKGIDYFTSITYLEI